MLEYENSKNTEQTENFAVFGLQNSLHARLLRRIILAQKGVIAAGVNFACDKALVRYDSEETRVETIIGRAGWGGVSLLIENEITQDLINRRREAEFSAVKRKLLLTIILAALLSGLAFFDLFGAAENYFHVAALVLFIFYFSKFSVMLKKRRTNCKTNSLIAKTKKIATIVRDDDKEELIDVESISENDIMLVKAGEKIAADGTIISGTSLIDEQIFSDASAKVEKFVGDKVYAETINLTNPITILISAVGKETEFAKMTREVEDEIMSDR